MLKEKTMKSLKFISFMAAILVLALTVSAVNGSCPQSQDNVQFGIEITTNINEEPLYIPVSLSNKKGRLFATVPVRSGDDVSAVRIAPVMEEGHVKLDLYLLTGDFWKAKSCADLRLLSNKQIESLIASYGETVTVNGDSADAGPLVSIKVVSLKSHRISKPMCRKS
jgi:hypothetical protein